jgi:hypothetical protein
MVVIDAGIYSKHVQVSDATSNRDWWRDLLIIDHFETIKHEFIFLWLISLVYLLYYSYIKILIDAAVHYEHGKAIKCDFKPGSVERSRDLYQRGILSSCRQCFQLPPPIKIEQFSSGIYFVSYLDSIEDIL